MTSELPWICSACQHRDADTNSCPAFPDGIPLKPLKEPLLHDDILPGQVGDTVFLLKDDLHSFTIYEVLKVAANGEDKQATEEGEDG